MKQPKLSDLRVDRKGTDAIRSGLTRSKKVKITVNIDEASLTLLRKMAARTGAPYQRLLNQLLRDALMRDGNQESRLERLERELAALKRKVAA